LNNSQEPIAGKRIFKLGGNARNWTAVSGDTSAHFQGGRPVNTIYWSTHWWRHALQGKKSDEIQDATSFFRCE